MKLHYSQTTTLRPTPIAPVSVPYEITLLSNQKAVISGNHVVSVPYEITLLSNKKGGYLMKKFVSVPYEITLLSNRNIKGQ